MIKQKKKYYRLILTILNHFSLIAGLSILLILIVASCKRKELRTSYQTTQKYVVIKDYEKLIIVCQKSIDDKLTCDTMEAFYVDEEYRLADGSLFMSTKKDSSYINIFDESQKQLIIIHALKEKGIIKGYYTKILNSFVNDIVKNQTTDLSLIVDEDSYGKECATIWMTQKIIYDKDYQIKEICEMTSFYPADE